MRRLRYGNWVLTAGGETCLIHRADRFRAGAQSVDEATGILAALYRRGIRNLVMQADGAWPRDPEPAEMMQLAFHNLNRLLRSRGRRPMALSLRPAPRSGHEDKIDAQRRGFLGRLAAPVSNWDEHDPAEAARALIAFQKDGSEHPDALFLHAPRIRGDTCTGCDACIRICPEGALTLVNDAPGQACYGTVPEACTGCGICMEICDSDAIEVKVLAKRASPVPMEPAICDACGVPFHDPRAHAPTTGLCRICRTTGHHKKLFQVLT